MPIEVEIRALIYALVAGGAVFLGWHLKGIVDDDKAEKLALAQAKIVEAQQAANQATIVADQQAQAEIKDQYEQRIATANASNADLASRLYKYEAGLSTGQVPAIPSAPGGTGTTPGEPAGYAILNQAIADSISACQRDAIRLQGWQDWYGKVSHDYAAR